MKTFRVTAIVGFTVILAAATSWTWILHGSPTVGIDDANIFFTYAENMAAGTGITFAQNGEPVEGFTSMLWMLMCAGIFSLGIDEAGVFALCFVLLLTTQMLFLNAIRNCAHQRSRHPLVYQAIYAALIICSPGYITWMTITLMDTCLWGLIIASMTYLLVSPPRSPATALVATIPFALAPAARPEALLIGPIFLVLLWLRCRSSGCRRPNRFCLFIALSFISTTAVLITFRIHYFGYPFPNTYYAKVSPSIAYNLLMGMKYLCKFILSGSVVGLAGGFLLIRCASWIGQVLASVRLDKSFGTLLHSPMSASAAVSLGALSLLLVPVLTGGDHFHLFRFFQPAYPLICLAPILWVTETSAFPTLDALPDLRWFQLKHLKGGVVAMVLGCWFLAYSFESSWYSMTLGDSPIAHEFQIAEQGIASGRRLNALLSEAGQLPSIGVITAGGIARTYSGPIIDLMGVNNSFIAHFGGDRKGAKNHAAFERDAFFHVEPDILLTSPPVPPGTSNFMTECLKGLHEDPRFVKRWRYGRLDSGNGHHTSVTAFMSTQFVDAAERDSGLRFQDTMTWANKWVEATVLPSGNTEPHP